MKYLRSKATIVSLLAGIFGIILILWAWQLPPFISSVKTTNNAYVQADIHYIHSDISGEIAEILVHDYQIIQKGDTLFVLKDNGLKETYEKALAEFQLKEIAIKQENLVTNNQDAENTIKADSLNKARLQQELLLAKANLDLAKNNLDARIITAPISGRLGEIKIKAGQYITKQSNLTTVVGDTIWVIANYKETEIANMKIGQPAQITVDALHGQIFDAHISAIGSATSAEFSDLKPDMSNQNYIKVTKRISVRMDFDQGQKNLDALLSGLSATTKIDTKAKISQ